MLACSLSWLRYATLCYALLRYASICRDLKVDHHQFYTTYAPLAEPVYGMLYHGTVCLNLHCGVMDGRRRERKREGEVR